MRDGRDGLEHYSHDAAGGCGWMILIGFGLLVTAIAVWWWLFVR